MKKITTIVLAVIYTANIMAQVPNYVPTNGLVGWWPFNGNANDESGNGNNGTVNGATLTTERSGNANKAYSFDGLNDFIDLGATSSLNSLQLNYTVSYWINKSDNDNGMVIASYAAGFAGGGWRYHSGIRGDSVDSRFMRSDIIKWAINYSNQGSIILNNWINICNVRNGINFSTYINGILSSNTIVPNVSINNAPQNTLATTRIGVNWPSATEYFDGKIDDIGIWNRALTQDEITALYTGCANNLAISPTNNNKMIGTNATFTATVTDPSPSYTWQSDLGQGFQTLNNLGKYTGTSTNTMSISNVQLSNHMVPIRAISVSGNCRDTSNIAYVKITDTCITKITKYDTIKVTDTLVINATLSGVSAPNNTNRLIIYPNPAKDHITIDYGVFSRMNGYTLKIVNTLGQTVFSSPINQQSSYINLSTWTGKGMYNVQIFDTQNNLIENRKIVLQ